MVYAHLFNFESDEFHVRTAKNLKEDEELIEAGFEYVTDLKQGQIIYKLFRKRKPWKPC